MTDRPPTDGEATDGGTDERTEGGADEENANAGTAGREPTERTDDQTDLPTVVSVAGPSGAGKTTLVESLCGALPERRVATVKSIHHDIEPDTPGTDTHRHRSAGADRVVGVTPSLTFEVARGGKGTDRTPEAEAAALRRVLERLAPGYDLVVIEGFGDVAVPTIRVGDGADPAGEVIGTGEDSIEDLVGAIDSLGPFDPAALGGGAESGDETGSEDGTGSHDGTGSEDGTETGAGMENAGDDGSRAETDRD